MKEGTNRREFLKRTGVISAALGAGIISLYDLISAPSTLANPSSQPNETQASGQIELPNLEYDIPRLSRVPDMNNDHSDNDWLDAGAKKYECKIVEGDKIIYHAFLYLGYMYSPCEGRLDLFDYANELTNRNPLCGHGFEDYTRFEKSDDTTLKKTDRLIHVDLAKMGDNCPWHDGGPTGLCVYYGDGSGWSGRNCSSSVRHVAFLKISDAEENPDKTTPNLGFKLQIPLFVKDSPLDIVNLYDPQKRILALRKHFSLGISSDCGKYSYSVIPKDKDSDEIDHSAQLWPYFGVRDLSFKLQEIVTETVTETAPAPQCELTEKATTTKTVEPTVTGTAEPVNFVKPLSDPVGIVVGAIAGISGAVAIEELVIKPRNKAKEGSEQQ